MIPGLNKGRWERPTDKMAIYFEFEHPRAWGVRVTLMPEGAEVEAVQGEKGAHYKAPRTLSTFVGPPTFWERLRGTTFEDKLLAEVQRKRAVARRANEEAGWAGDALEPVPQGPKAQ